MVHQSISFRVEQAVHDRFMSATDRLGLNASKVLREALTERLEELEKLFAQISFDVKDEASNYMRSKHEIKELEKRQKEVKNELQRLHGKIEKARERQRHPAGRRRTGSWADCHRRGSIASLPTTDPAP